MKRFIFIFFLFNFDLTFASPWIANQNTLYLSFIQDSVDDEVIKYFNSELKLDKNISKIVNFFVPFKKEVVSLYYELKILDFISMNTNYTILSTNNIVINTQIKTKILEYKQFLLTLITSIVTDTIKVDNKTKINNILIGGGISIGKSIKNNFMYADLIYTANKNIKKIDLILEYGRSLFSNENLDCFLITNYSYNTYFSKYDEIDKKIKTDTIKNFDTLTTDNKNQQNLINHTKLMQLLFDFLDNNKIISQENKVTIGMLIKFKQVDLSLNIAVTKSTIDTKSKIGQNNKYESIKLNIGLGIVF